MTHVNLVSYIVMYSSLRPHAMVKPNNLNNILIKMEKSNIPDRVLDVDDCIAIDCIHGRYVVLVEAELMQTHGKIYISC